MLRRTIVWLLFVAVMGVGYAGALRWQQGVRVSLNGWDADRARKRELPIPVRTHLVSQEMVGEVIGATCVTSPHSYAPLHVTLNSASVPFNRLKRVHVQEGDVVAKGDTLFELEDKLIKAVVEKESARLRLCQAQVATYKELKERRAASSSEVQLAEADLAEAKLSLALAEQDLEYCVIRSPVDGVVGAVQLAEGVMAPDSAELGSVYRMDPIIVTMDFPVERLGELQVGQEAEVVLDSFPNEKLTGRVTGVAPNGSVQTRVIHALIEVENPELRLRGGLPGYCRIAPAEKSVTTVPRVAVIRRKNRSMVMKVERDKAYATPVTTGAMVREGYIEIQNGLDIGEEVVIFGQEDLKEGDAVNTDWRQWASRKSDHLVGSN